MRRHRAGRHVILLWSTVVLALPAAACNFPEAAPAAPFSTDLAQPTDTSTSVPLPASTATPSTTATPAPTPIPSELVWFGPNMGSSDFADLFAEPEEWSEARSRIDVFKFHSQNLLYNDCAICGDNNLSAFVPVQAFERLTEWGVATAIDVGAVKEWDCTGAQEVRVARTVVENVQSHGGTVTFLVMDEPFMGGQASPTGSNPCGLTMEQTADVTAWFMRQVQAAHPDIVVGNTEPYPYFSAAELEQWIEALEARGTPPAFFHLDVNMVEGGSRLDRRLVVADLQTLSRFFQEHQIPFGVIFTANTNWDARSDRVYFDSTMEWMQLVNDAIGKPQQVVFNSWLGPTTDGISNRPGVHETPINLPENDPSIYSHTRLILEALDMLDW
ncbi:MAG TPA: hypothetical protein VFI11_00260 [Anaerolineales bacterium]|nr:hypothetical protein [Anaerolineales bacterium]